MAFNHCPGCYRCFLDHERNSLENFGLAIQTKRTYDQSLQDTILCGYEGLIKSFLRNSSQDGNNGGNSHLGEAQKAAFLQQTDHYAAWGAKAMNIGCILDTPLNHDEMFVAEHKRYLKVWSQRSKQQAKDQIENDTRAPANWDGFTEVYPSHPYPPSVSPHGRVHACPSSRVSWSSGGSFGSNSSAENSQE